MGEEKEPKPEEQAEQHEEHEELEAPVIGSPEIEMEDLSHPVAVPSDEEEVEDDEEEKEPLSLITNLLSEAPAKRWQGQENV